MPDPLDPDQPAPQTGRGFAGMWQPPSVEEAAGLFPQYEVLGLLGRGGMGAVYQARQIALDRLVAIKLLPLEVSADRDFADRFVREARAMGKLTHPNIITVFDFGQTSEGHLYFAMEYVAGANLHAVIHHLGLTPAQALSICGQVCTALAYAHSKGVVHRDIKPANVMLDAEGNAKVADFGLARLVDPGEQLGHTQTGTVMGTPDYMAPEQKRGMNVDHRADIYSVGVMLYEMLCKETPQGAFEPASTRTGCDARIDQVILRAMQQAPERRYQSTLEMKAAVDEANRPHRGARPVAASARKKSHALLYAGLAAGIVALAGGSAYLALGVRKKPQASTAPPVPVAENPSSASTPRGPAPPLPAATPVPLAASPPTPGPAPSSPQRIVTLADGHRYQFVGNKVSWSEAKARAERMGGHLARIESARELNLLTSILGREVLQPGQCLWLDGVSRQAGEWKWSDGTEATAIIESFKPSFDVGKTPGRGDLPAYLNLLRYDAGLTDFRLNDHSEGETEPASHWRQQIVGYIVEWDSAVPSFAKSATPAPTFVPATPEPKPLSATAKWIADQEPQWRAAYQREAGDAFDKGIGDLNKQYVAVIDRLRTAATSGNQLDDAVFYRDERARFDRESAVPMEDEARCPAALKPPRTAYRAQRAKLEKDRFDRAKALHGRIDAILAQSQTALTQRQRLDEALEMKAKREELAKAWLQLTEASATAEPSVMANKPGTPVPMGATMAPPPRGPKLRTREAVERLLALGAEVYLDSWKGENRVTDVAQVKSEKQTIYSFVLRVPRGGAPINEEDFAILDSLPDLRRVTLDNQGNLTDAAFARLRLAKDLEHLHLLGKTQLTPAAFATLPAFSSLTLLSLYAQVGCTDAAMAHLGACRGLGTLFLKGLPLTDDGFAHLGKLGNLTRLEIGSLKQVTGGGFASLVGCKNLQSLAIEDPIPGEALTHVAKLRGVTELVFQRCPVTDTDLAPLATMASLRELDLTNAKVIGSAFATWPVRSALVRLSLKNTPGQDDAAFLAIATAFPKLEHLTATLAANTTPAGIATLGKLRSLSTLHFEPGRLNDALAVEVGKLDQLRSLQISGTLSDEGVASIAKLTTLTSIHWEKPPVTEAALESYARMRGLRSWRYYYQTPKEDADKLKAALPGVNVSR